MLPVTDETAHLELSGVSWRKSHRSNPHGNCVELADLPGGAVAVRNSRNPYGTALVYPRMAFVAFIQGVKNGDFDGVRDPCRH